METSLRTKALYVLLFFLLLALLPARSFAMEELKVGYVPGTGFLEENRPGHMQGNGYEYMEFLSGFLGAKFIYVPCINWWEAGDKLNTGEIDLLPAMPGNYKTLPFAQRTDHVIARFPMELVVQDDFSGGQVKIGTLDYNYPIPSLPQIAQEHGFHYELVTFHDPAEMKKEFASRALDGYIQPLLHPDKEERVLALFDRVSYRLLLKQGRPELFRRVNAAMDELLLNQPNIRNRLNDKYERSKGFPLVLSPAETAYLQTKPTLRVAVLIQEKPYFYQNENAGWCGATKALMEQLEKDLHVQIEIVETSTPAEIQRLITRGTVDLVADVPSDFSWLDGLGLIPTQSYLDIGFVPITRHGADLPEKPRVAAIAGLYETTTFVKAQYPEEQIIYFPNWTECCQAVSNNLADITYLPRAAVPYLLEATSAYNLSAGTEQIFSSTISIGVSKNADLRLWQIINKEINHLPPRLLTDALTHGAQESIRFSPRYLLYHYPLQTALLIMMVMGTIIGLFYYRSRTYNRQLAKMEKLACTDAQLQIPNMRYLEHNIQARQQSNDKDHPSYLMALSISCPQENNHSRAQWTESLQAAARDLNSKDWVQITVAGAITGELLCLCTAANSQQILNFAAEFITDSEQPGDGQWQAGLCPLAGQNLATTAEKAALACQAAKAKGAKAKLWDAQLEKSLSQD
ncbi:extracellular solute-binding protein, family 3 [Selenomonas ruminantium]|uniref:Extracellular solute-binding protein, family 3 n=1 Tax=Selenomonas ruminantium TaxID=971 RepID=A0A1M6S6C7_SELRU|nr:transporter substrate-binding domain-containing protein [Selenomonas ruminantium]SHK40332.1 extracellular solute-binding protein, family 3 [Selenomonas ruminantium]